MKLNRNTAKYEIDLRPIIDAIDPKLSEIGILTSKNLWKDNYKSKANVE